MRKGNFAFKMILGIILLSLIIPIKPPVSHAQAKLCCKKFCAHHIKNTPKPGYHGAHKKTSENRPVHCCQNSCAQEIFRGDPKIPALNNLKTEVDLINLKFVRTIAFWEDIWIPKNLSSWIFKKTPSKNTQLSPLFIINSSLLI